MSRLLILVLLHSTAALAQLPTAGTSDPDVTVAAPPEATRADPSLGAAQRPVSGGVRILRELGSGVLWGLAGGAAGALIGAGAGLTMDLTHQCTSGGFLSIPCFITGGVIGGFAGIPLGSVFGVWRGGDGVGSVFGAIAGGVVGVLVSVAFFPLALVLPMVGAILGYEYSRVLLSAPPPPDRRPRATSGEPLTALPFSTPDGGRGLLVATHF